MNANYYLFHQSIFFHAFSFCYLYSETVVVVHLSSQTLISQHDVITMESHSLDLYILI